MSSISKDPRSGEIRRHHLHRVNRAGVAPKFYLWGLGAGEFIRCPML